MPAAERQLRVRRQTTYGSHGSFCGGEPAARPARSAAAGSAIDAGDGAGCTGMYPERSGPLTACLDLLLHAPTVLCLCQNKQD